MESDWVIKALQVLENGRASLLSRLEAHSIGTLLGQSGKEGFHGRVVITVSCATHTHLDARFSQHGLVALAGKLTAAVRMRQESCLWTPIGQCHTPRQFDQVLI